MKASGSCIPPGGVQGSGLGALGIQPQGLFMGFRVSGVILFRKTYLCKEHVCIYIYIYIYICMPTRSFAVFRNLKLWHWSGRVSQCFGEVQLHG